MGLNILVGIASFLIGALIVWKLVNRRSENGGFLRLFAEHNKAFDGSIFMFLLFMTLWITYLNPMGLEGEIRADLVHLFTYAIGVMTGFLFKNGNGEKKGE